MEHLSVKRSLRMWLTLLGIGAVCVGCFQPTQAVMCDVDIYGWNESAVVNTENGDTTTLRDIEIVIRANRNFRLDTLHLKVRVLRPDLSFYDQEVKLPIRHRRRPASLRLIDQIPYRRRVVLSMEGTYCFNLKPVGIVEGVEAVGINIVKSLDQEESEVVDIATEEPTQTESVATKDSEKDITENAD